MSPTRHPNHLTNRPSHRHDLHRLLECDWPSHEPTPDTTRGLWLAGLTAVFTTVAVAIVLMHSGPGWHELALPFAPLTMFAISLLAAGRSKVRGDR